MGDSTFVVDYSHIPAGVRLTYPRKEYPSLDDYYVWKEKNNISRFTEDDIKDIKKLHRDGLTLMAIGRKYSVSHTTISRVVRNWKRKPIRSNKINKEIADKIREEYALGNISQPKLGAKYGIKQSTVSEIITGKRWTDIQNM